MTLDWLLANRERNEPCLRDRVPEGPSDERTMLLELASNLQNWPARNVVFQKALDRAAEDLVRMAAEHDPV